MARALFLKPIKGAGGDLPSVMGFIRNAEEIEHYALHEADLSGYAALLLPAHLDQRYFGTLSTKVSDWLDRGGTLVFNGHVAWPMLPEFNAFVALEKRNLENLQIHRIADHPVFAGVDMADLTYRRGVAGFYARGCNPPPPSAVPVLGVGPDRVPCDWVYERPGGGRIFMHAGNDLWMYASDKTSARRIVPQLMDWVLGAAA